jgi:glycosyltransferase involved in cell wall biosynthesis
MSVRDFSPISVIVPLHNLSGNLGEIEGWLSKALGLGFSVIIVDDASSAETKLKLIEIELKADSRKLTVIHGIFGGPGAARNKGLELASPGWIIFWDSDDQPDVFSTLEMIVNAESKNKTIAVGMWQKMPQGEEFTSDTTSAQAKRMGNDFFQIITNPGIWRWAFKFDSSAPSKFPNLRMGEDQLFLVSLNIPYSEVYRYPQVIYSYNQSSPTQLTKNQTALRELSSIDSEVRKVFSRLKRPSLLSICLAIKIYLISIKWKFR